MAHAQEIADLQNQVQQLLHAQAQQAQQLQQAQQAHAAALQAQQAAEAAAQQAQQHAQGGAGGGGRGRVKIMTFSNGQDEDWLVWKFHFDKAKTLNGYTVQEAKLALSAAMKGRAAAAVMDIDVANQQETLDQLLAHYDGRFLPASASQMARVSFDQAAQKPNETILDFHSRLRQLWNRAYPNNADVVLLIRKFSLGLRKREIREQVVRQNPQTYGTALEAAQNEASVMRVVSITETGSTVEPMEIGMVAAIGRRTAQGKSRAKSGGARPKTIGNLDRKGPAKNGNGKTQHCYFCNKPGHYKSSCFLYQKAKKALSGRGGSSANDRRQPTWKKNFKTNYKKSNQYSHRTIAMMEALMDEPESDELNDEDVIAVLDQLEELEDEPLDEEVEQDGLADDGEDTDEDFQ